MAQANIYVSKIETIPAKEPKKTDVMHFKVSRILGLAFRNTLNYSTSNNLFLALLRMLQNHPEIVQELNEYLATEEYVRV